ncbi:MAG TPA: lysophospholipid acyltransferase family protein [Alphaproteobacteria bacterium]|nr:lysophospholipid acyltransferase family protein [Alphaproteobacteria bacterium]
MRFLRNLILNIALYGSIFGMAFLMLPTLLLPRKQLLFFVHIWMNELEWVNTHIGGMKYRVTGWENLPEGACIVAPKHQSAWETIMLHRMFKDPAIILKKELLMFPLIGWFMTRSQMIPIDRKGRAAALAKMMRAAHRAADDGRRIVIFPQGTRVPVGVDAPYKSGIVGIYKELKLPIVPVALNSGLLWPKNSFFKKPGLITVEILPQIPAGLPREEMMTRLKDELETASNRLAKLSS